MANRRKAVPSSEATALVPTAAAPSRIARSSPKHSTSEKAVACRSETPRATASFRSKPSDEDVAKLREYQRAFRAIGAMMGGLYGTDQARLMAHGLAALGVSEEIRRDLLEHFAMNRSSFMQDFMG